ncbi:MAG: hypothetical protein Ct9H300mP29_6470 [Candidatus Neomarinimicrobiota bacterium]|nr:MAG: hypothetical protein Ct9H300mP29_6470 [Candidatus Neomarinimicrobiota bacterium]
MLRGNGHDIRTIIPKYGFISERKYILREVIRLGRYLLNFAGEDKIAVPKVLLYQDTCSSVFS